MHGSGAFVLFLVFGGLGVLRPIARAVATRISGEHGQRDRIRQLEGELRDTSARLSETEAELGRALEKADFMERLLAKPGAPGGPPAPPPAVPPPEPPETPPR
jgi:hypothetical protein